MRAWSPSLTILSPAPPDVDVEPHELPWHAQLQGPRLKGSQVKRSKNFLTSTRTAAAAQGCFLLRSPPGATSASALVACLQMMSSVDLPGPQATKGLSIMLTQCLAMSLLHLVYNLHRPVKTTVGRSPGLPGPFGKKGTW